MSYNKFTFSIIIAIYNTEKYLSEAIESIINQSFDFNNVQIVLVDDGSTDGCKDICLSYKNKYPNNIIYVSQENAGQSVARNNGLKFASGKYINFLDSDDILDLNTLYDVNDFFNKNDDQIDVVVIQRHNFGVVNGPTYLNNKYNLTRVVDIDEEFDFPQVSISASFIRRIALSEEFNPELTISEDSLLLNKTILKKCKYGVVSTARYMYRKRAEQNSTIDTKKYKKNYFNQRIEQYFKELISYSMFNHGKVLRYIQSILMYDLQWYFKDNTHHVLNQSELVEFHNSVWEILQLIDDDIILSQRFLDERLKYHILNFKYDNPNFELISNSDNLLLSYGGKFFDNVTNQKIVLTKVYCKSNLLYIKGFFDTYLDNIHLNLFLNNSPCELFKIKGEEVYSLNRKISNRFHFMTILDLNEKMNNISFKISINSKEYSLPIHNMSFNEDVYLDNSNLSFNFNNTSDESDISLKNQINQYLQEYSSSDEIIDVLYFEKEVFGIRINPKVTIIIPVFNPGSLLYKCLESVANQSLRDIEIICVNDGSTDNSAEVLDRYSEFDSRFKIFHQKNQGAGIARNKGIQESTGDYIIFLDSDDWVEVDMCEKLYNHAEKLNSDVVIFDALWHTLDGRISKFSYFNEFNEDYNTFSFDYHFIKNKVMVGSLGVIWSKFYKSSFIKNNDLKFPRHKIYNDVEFYFKTTLLSKNMSYFPKTFYHYIRLGQPSLQTSFRKGEDELIWFEVLDGLYKFFIEYKLMDEFRLDFINYCMYYTMGKLNNIEDRFQLIFLDKFKKFFNMLNPTIEEFDELKSKQLTYYSPITVEYMPLYDSIMSDDIQTYKLYLLELKLKDAKDKLENKLDEFNDDFYESLRESFINFKLDSDVITKLSSDLEKLYWSFINFELCAEFVLFNKSFMEENFKTINKQELCDQIDKFNNIGVNLDRRDKLIIVSLTSTPTKINDTIYCLYSLLNQTFKPDKVILWLSNEQFFDERDIPSNLLKLKDCGLSIKFCDEFKSYNKLIPALKEFSDDYIVTVNEDIYYPNYWLESLWNQYKKSPNTIISSKSKIISFESNEINGEYENWECVNSGGVSSYLNFPTQDGSTLYFPNALSNKVNDKFLFENICPTDESIWFWAMSILNKTKITVVEDPMNDLFHICESDEISVDDEYVSSIIYKNKIKNMQIKNVIAQFPEILDIINNF